MGRKIEELPPSIALSVEGILLSVVARNLVQYGLLALATPLQDVDDILHKLEFKMLSALGVNQHVKTE